MSLIDVQTECFVNHTDEFIASFKMKRVERLDSMYRCYFGWLSMPFLFTAIILAVLYITVVCRIIIKKRVSRKCYALLINRTFGDLLSCLTALATSVYVLSVEHVNHNIFTIMEILFFGGFWSAMVSYVTLSIVKFLSVWKPFCYRQVITMKRCVYLMVLSWVLFFVMVSPAFLALAFVEIQSWHQWSGCEYETCFFVMLQLRYVIIVIVYLVTLIVFAITYLLIKRSERVMESFRRKRTSGGTVGASSENSLRFPLWKLTLNVGTFGGLSFSYVLWCICLVIHRDHCYFIRNFVELTHLLGVVRCTLLLRILVDPIISFITDCQIKQEVLNCFRNGYTVKSTGTERCSPHVSNSRKSTEGSYIECEQTDMRCAT